MNRRIFAAALASTLLLAGCATHQPQDDQNAELFRHCGAIASMGEHIGQGRARGMDAAAAADYAAKAFAKARNTQVNEAINVNAMVYTMLVYRLDQYKPATASAYTLAACMTIKGLGKAMPSDAASEQQLNQVLRTCEHTAANRDELGACVLNGIKPMTASFESLGA